MHNRCDKHKNYKDCYVCERWMSLKKFVEDIQKIDNYKHLIKAISTSYLQLVHKKK